MKLTVCELPDASVDLDDGFAGLVEHVRTAGSDLVLLPEMPFFPWIAGARPYRPESWAAALDAHDRWIPRLAELSRAVVLGTRPATRDGRRVNEGFVIDRNGTYTAVHEKVFLPDEAGFWEATWYEPGTPAFETVDVGGVRIGFLICTEMWFTEHARAYAHDGIHVLACPRAVAVETVDKWVAGGRAAAVMSGAFCLSSNRGGVDATGARWGGTGWIIEPEEADVLALTTTDEPWVTVDVDLADADRAKTTYPRYVKEIER
jgi:N-carbamoylputrescine amidase